MSSIYVVRSGRIRPGTTDTGANGAPRGAGELATETVALPATPHSLREGATLGLVVATSTWLWVAAVDAIAGDPFRTFTVLGGIAIFTMLHYLLNVVYGVAVVSGLRTAAREPGAIMAVVFGFLMVEFGLALISTFASNLGLGTLAWLRIFGGSLIGSAIAVAVLSRRHPLAERLRRANDERQDD
jgi:hypothetical protein